MRTVEVLNELIHARTAELETARAWMRAAQAWMDQAEDTLLDLDLCGNDQHVEALIQRRPSRVDEANDER